MNSMWRNALWCVVGALLGFMAGWAASPSQEPVKEGETVAAPLPHAEEEARPRRTPLRAGGAGAASTGAKPGTDAGGDPRWDESSAGYYRRRAEERRASRESVFSARRGEEADEGVSPSWNPYVPEVLGPEGFEEQVKLAMEECQPAMELVGFDCDEPPCMAIFRADDSNASNGLVSEDCPAWSEPFGTTVTQSSDTFDCPDGVSETMMIIGSTRTSDWIDDPAPGQRGNNMSRLMARSQAVKDSWTCATD